MSLTLGEKLREAREERGITISEVAEQTRISSLYLENIENDDYKILPGGIFNKGFIKSFAKYVGVDEQEALLDYSRAIATSEEAGEPELKTYRPEVLTDDRSGSSMIPTVIVAVVILGLMTAGILFLVRYLQRPSEIPVANKTAAGNSNQSTDSNSGSDTSATVGPDMASLNVELKADQVVKVVVTTDGVKSISNVAGSAPASYSPKESLTLDFLKWNVSHLKLTINGKPIDLPADSLDPKDKGRIIFTISRDNLAEIWSSGKISTSVPSVAADPDANANIAPPPGQAVPGPAGQTKVVPVAPKPVGAVNASANTAVKPAATPKTVIVPSAPANKPVGTKP